MIDRLLDKFEPQRRHLAFLVGLLVLTFALTVMLAVKAHRAEVARQQQAQAVLQDLVAKSAGEWGRQLDGRVSAAIVHSFRNVIRSMSVRRDMSVVDFANRLDVEALCPECRHNSDALLFSANLITGEVETIGSNALPAALLEQILTAVAVHDMAQLNDSVAMRLHMSGASDQGAAVVLVRLGTQGEPVRGVGYVVPAQVLGELSLRIFDALPLLPNSLAQGMPNDSFFSAHASLGGLTLAATTPDVEFVAVDTIRTPPLQGLVLQVGIRDNAATKLLIDGAVTSGVPLLLTLLFTICGLIVLALLLVRREAELVRLRADFISGVSHELRTPLAQIRMFTETLLLNRVRSDVERRRSLEIIDQEARRLTHLVENVLLFSKSEGGRRTPLAPEPTDLAAEVRRAAESFGPLCRPRDVGLRTELQDGITVAVDRGALRQIMVNLLDNALKYGPSGQRVTVGVALFDDNGRVWVDDEGPGIPAEDRERVFDSFYRLPRDVESRSSGSGIGLAVVRELARLHGGDAWAEVAPGGGTRIVAQFPDAYLRTEPAADLAAAS